MEDKTKEKEEKMVTISKKEYQALLADSELLAALEAAGVDNWGGYSEAIQAVTNEE